MAATKKRKKDADFPRPSSLTDALAISAAKAYAPSEERQAKPARGGKKAKKPAARKRKA